MPRRGIQEASPPRVQGLAQYHRLPAQAPGALGDWRMAVETEGAAAGVGVLLGSHTSLRLPTQSALVLPQSPLVSLRCLGIQRCRTCPSSLPTWSPQRKRSVHTQPALLLSALHLPALYLNACQYCRLTISLSWSFCTAVADLLCSLACLSLLLLPSDGNCRMSTAARLAAPTPACPTKAKP